MLEIRPVFQKSVCMQEKQIVKATGCNDYLIGGIVVEILQESTFNCNARCKREKVNGETHSIRHPLLNRAAKIKLSPLNLFCDFPWRNRRESDSTLALKQFADLIGQR